MGFGVSNGRYRETRRADQFKLDFTTLNVLRCRGLRNSRRFDQIRSGVPDISFESITNGENLFETFRWIRIIRNPAPGNDGVCLREIGQSEGGAIFRGVAEQIKQNEYQPQVPRLIEIPKHPGPGTRPIRMPSAIDHVVATSINVPLAAGANRILLPTCYGFRKGRDPWQMLAAVVTQLESPAATLLVNDDIRRAFEFVPVDRVMELLRELSLEARLIDLIRSLVTVGNDDCTVGIHQGSELSPTLLNLLLHYMLDVPFRDRFPDVPLHRYADNLAMVVLGMTAADAGRYHDEISRLLATAGMELKREDGGIFDLSHQTTTLLGFRLSKPQDRVLIQLSDTVETLVSANLDELVRIEGRDPQRARECLIGWSGSLGPAYQDTDVGRVCADAIRTARSFRFPNVVSVQDLRRKWQSAHQRWETMLRSARGQSMGLYRG